MTTCTGIIPMTKAEAMSASNLPNIKLIQSNHRCHSYVLDFVVALSSIMAYFQVYHGGVATSYAPTLQGNVLDHPGSQLQGAASGRDLLFIPHETLGDVFVGGTRNTAIAYQELVRSIKAPVDGPSTPAIAELLEGLAQAMFTRYWETNLDSIKSVHGERKDWPDLLRFCAVVRDTMSHGGNLNLFASVAPVSYWGLNYDRSMNGKRIIHTDLSAADIFFLMLDVDAAF